MTRFAVQEIDRVTAAFGATDTRSMMPPYAEIPDEFKRGRTVWNKLVSDWFFGGVADLELTPQEGVDRDAALRHVAAIMRSFEPKHEHKEAGCAYLLSQWFTNPRWTQRARERPAV